MKMNCKGKATLYPVSYTHLVAIARNKETGSSATLFVLDENGVGQVVLASGYSATYLSLIHIFSKVFYQDFP